MSGALVLMAKAPVVGTTNTRLGADIGMHAAAAMQRAFIVDWLERDLSMARAVAFSGEASELSTLAEALGWGSFDQRGDGLGPRMLQALRAFDGPTVVVGTDVVSLPSALLHEALAALETADVVLGPSRDGGFYLIGASAPPDTLFDGLTWSHADVLTDTLTRVLGLGLRVHLLPTWYDVDNVADLRWLRVHCAGPLSGLLPHRPPRTLALAGQVLTDSKPRDTGNR